MGFILPLLAQSVGTSDYKAWKRAVFSTPNLMQTEPNRGD